MKTPSTIMALVRYEKGIMRCIRNFKSLPRSIASKFDLGIICYDPDILLNAALCLCSSEKMSQFGRFYAAKLAQHSMACVACLADLVCCKRDEVPDRIVP